MSEKVHVCNIKREQGYLYFIDRHGNVSRSKKGQPYKDVICPNMGNFTRENGWMYFLDKDGDVSRSRMRGFREMIEVLENIQKGEEVWLKD